MQNVYLESRYSFPLAGGTHLFYLPDSITVPNPRRYELQVSLPEASFSLTNYAVRDGNNSLAVSYGNGDEQTIRLPVGNPSIDDVTELLDEELLHGWTAKYSLARNTLSFRNEDGSAPALSVDAEGTTCGPLLGLTPTIYRTGPPQALEGLGGVDLAGTSHFYIASNLRTNNRDPLTLQASNILAKVPITRAPNGIEKYRPPDADVFRLADRAVHYITVAVLDDQLRPVDFNGGGWSVTMSFQVVEQRSVEPPVDYRTLIHGPLGGAEDAPPDQRQDEHTGGPERAAVADSGAEQRGVRGDSGGGGGPGGPEQRGV